MRMPQFKRLLHVHSSLHMTLPSHKDDCQSHQQLFDLTTLVILKGNEFLNRIPTYLTQSLVTTINMRKLVWTTW